MAFCRPRKRNWSEESLRTNSVSLRPFRRAKAMAGTRATCPPSPSPQSEQGLRHLISCLAHSWTNPRCRNLGVTKEGASTVKKVLDSEASMVGLVLKTTCLKARMGSPWAAWGKCRIPGTLEVADSERVTSRIITWSMMEKNHGMMTRCQPWNSWRPMPRSTITL